jgi:aspartate-semialdehyde dehydrogenase
MTTYASSSKIPVGILGATGAVGQRFVQLLEHHPWFTLTEVAASERSAGKNYSAATRWFLPGDVPDAAGALTVARAGEPLTAPILFSGLDGEVAGEIEPYYAGRGHLVVSNTKSFRMNDDVPLLIPEVNPDSLDLLRRQQSNGSGGGIVTNPNCSVVGLALALAPLQQAFGIESVCVTTLQALSGAGHPGVASLDGLGNIIPFIGGEEEKIETEPLKILGAKFPISVSVNRVPVRDGHTESVFVKLNRRTNLAEIGAALRGFSGEPQQRKLPSAPARPIIVIDAENRPQPLRDVEREQGMAVFVGNLRADPVYDAKFTLLVHNTIRGAAGAALLNAELLVARGLVRGVRAHAGAPSC